MKKYLVTLLILITSLFAYAEPIKLAWDDYDYVSEAVVGYRFHMGAKPGEYTNIIDLPWAGAKRYILLGLDPGTYYATMTAYNGYGLESDYSNEISFTVTERTDPTPPTPLVNVQMTIEQSVNLRDWEVLKTWVQESGNKVNFYRLKVEPAPEQP